MNAYQTQLFNELNELHKNNEAFFVSEQELDGVQYRVFLYRLASYSDWLAPSATESRGIMFRMEGEEAVELVSMPMEKFWNLGENPFTMNLDHQNFEMAMLKEDGSLISTFNHLNNMRLKSKGSVKSLQATDAMNWLAEEAEYTAALQEWVDNNHTVNLEWTSPLNQIVVRYNVPSLVVLNVRNNENGEYVSREELENSNLSKWLVRLDNAFFEGKSLEELRAVKDIEGWVVWNGEQHWKLKTDWYNTLHKTKDSLDSPKALFMNAINDTLDDLIALIDGNEVAQLQVKVMGDIVSKFYNHYSNIVEEFHKENAELDMKTYAIKAQKEIDNKGIAHVAIGVKNGNRKHNVKTWMEKNYQQFVSEYENTFPAQYNELVKTLQE